MTAALLFLIILSVNGAENQSEAGFNKEQTNQNADGNSHNCRMEERIAAEQNGENADNQMQNPNFGTGRLGHGHCHDDVDDTHQHEPCCGQINHKSVRNQEESWEYQQADTEDNRYDAEHKANAESFVTDTLNDAENTVNRRDNRDEIAVAQEGG